MSTTPLIRIVCAVPRMDLFKTGAEILATLNIILFSDSTLMFSYSLVSHMESDTFMQSEEICVCVLKNIRGMLLKPPELNDIVSIHTHLLCMCILSIRLCTQELLLLFNVHHFAYIYSAGSHPP